ncbi:MAG TPA: cobalamin biosynthesis protein CbiD [Methanothermococcus okinawensis]|uniref:Cobalt-precorrin-5B C(1)-methyltransferase n=1 Tax=Methanothermococcus okinawensis TaxID=155863 RepID=A0A832ZIA9_9EURY|nr:cobalamin biosynthesis protein CbiD [Methanococcaceae archaeon]HIP84890.1 cobalamin biosynthesis protein CbiD [Methanothermococcus okinawensis]HIP91137.1 cobalamin biosynthesis protein CbiD [Methanothermococcus okinawensis]
MIYDFRKEKRYGYTTGACAAAGAYCGIYYLKKGVKLDYVEIENDRGDILIIPVEKIEGDLSSRCATVTVRKFAGEDIDITDGIEVVVNSEIVKWKGGERIKIVGGRGIGIVTKDGLQVKKGDWAINPKPRELIVRNITPLLEEDEGVVVRISVPRGEELAERTLNSKLGILGGISILGTTGIVRPMSNEAYRESLVPQIDIALGKNHRILVFTPGNIGTRYARELLDVEEDQIVEVSNFWDFMIDKAQEKGVEGILIFGHGGKIVKLAGGIYNTHSKVADGRNEILTAYSSLYIDSRDTLRRILYSNTTEEIVDILRGEGVLHKVFDHIARRVVERARNRWKKIDFSCIIIDMKGNILGSYIGDKFLPLVKNLGKR